MHCSSLQQEAPVGRGRMRRWQQYSSLYKEAAVRRGYKQVGGNNNSRTPYEEDEEEGDNIDSCTLLSPATGSAVRRKRRRWQQYLMHS